MKKSTSTTKRSKFLFFTLWIFTAGISLATGWFGHEYRQKEKIALLEEEISTLSIRNKRIAYKKVKQKKEDEKKIQLLQNKLDDQKTAFDREKDALSQENREQSRKLEDMTKERDALQVALEKKAEKTKHMPGLEEEVEALEKEIKLLSEELKEKERQFLIELSDKLFNAIYHQMSNMNDDKGGRDAYDKEKLFAIAQKISDAVLGIEYSGNETDREVFTKRNEGKSYLLDERTVDMIASNIAKKLQGMLERGEIDAELADQIIDILENLQKQEIDKRIKEKMSVIN